MKITYEEPHDFSIHHYKKTSGVARINMHQVREVPRLSQRFLRVSRARGYLTLDRQAIAVRHYLVSTNIQPNQPPGWWGLVVASAHPHHEIMGVGEHKPFDAFDLGTSGFKIEWKRGCRICLLTLTKKNYENALDVLSVQTPDQPHWYTARIQERKGPGAIRVIEDHSILCWYNLL